MEEKCITILGSTGSIGRQALEVCGFNNIGVDAIAAASSEVLLEEQVRRYKPRLCALSDVKKAEDLKIRIADTNTRVYAGERGILDMISDSVCDTVINSIIGGAGLLPTLTAIESGKSVALANKETLVTAGGMVMNAVKKNKVSLLPIDSEHCAIFQCLMNGRRDEVSRLILTASGGPFYGRSIGELSGVSVEQALNHPTWKMGRKITIDSATLMNKCFEMIEAAYLFDFPYNMIEVLIHRESIIHSMVEYNDGAIIAQMCLPDMRMCISYALSYPFRVRGMCKKTDLAEIGRLTFDRPDTKTFSALELAPFALSQGGVIPAVLNGANEQAVELFLNGKISFTDITFLVTDIVHGYKNIDNPVLDDILEAGRRAKELVKEAAV